MRISDLSSDIVQWLYQHGGGKASAEDIEQGIALRANERKKFIKALQRLENRGEISRGAGGRYTLGDENKVVVGTVQFFRSGAGVVRTDKRREVMVARRHMGTALPGDEVTVQLDQRRKSRDDERETGRVIGIVARGALEIVGTIRHAFGKPVLVAADPRYPRPFTVASLGGAEEGERVVARVGRWENEHDEPVAEVVDRIGPGADPSLDTLTVIRQFHLRTEFPEPVLREAERASVASGFGQEGREDLRDLPTFTIDPVTARDFDDALSLQTDEHGRSVLGVHIADVSHYVRPGTALDDEAQIRGNSVYLPDTVLPMLPEQLSNGVCSLKPGVDRLAFSAFLTFDEHGSVCSSRFTRSVICSDVRFTYEQALVALETPLGELPPDHTAVEGLDVHGLLLQIKGLALGLRKARFAKHALDIDLPECEVTIGKHGLIEDVELVESDISHQLVEECMVAANEAVDRELSRRRVPLIHRLHEPPKPERIEKVTDELVSMGYSPGNLNHRTNLSAFLASVRDDPMAHHVRTAILRSMNRARYSAEEGGHYGLAKRYYTHFTSPIRRYTDLVIHRLLNDLITGQPVAIRQERLIEIAANCSKTEETAEKAERELIEVKKYRYLAQQLESGSPEVYEGVVVKTLRPGCIVDVLALQMDGFLSYEEVARVSKRKPAAPTRRGRFSSPGSRALELGQRVQVQVAKVNIDTRNVDLALSKVPERAGPRTGVRPGAAKASGGGKRPRKGGDAASHRKSTPRKKRRGRRG